MKVLKFLGVLLLVGVFSACQEENCSLDCKNGGQANEDAFGCYCACANGYVGALCDVEDLCVTQSVDCGQNGTCSNGACACDDGYEGSLCDVESREKFLGTYSAIWLCGNWSGDVGIITIHKDLNDVDEVTITYTYSDGTSHVINNGKIENGTTIKFRDIRFGDDIDFVGSYSVNPSTNQAEIDGTFEWGDGSNTQSCQGTWYKQ